MRHLRSGTSRQHGRLPPWAVVWCATVLVGCSSESSPDVTVDATGGGDRNAFVAWQAIPLRESPDVTGAALTAAGNDVFLWGGEVSWGAGIPTGEGALLRSGAEEWEPIAASVLAPMHNPVAVWTGSEVLVCCGLSQEVAAASYDLERDRWTRRPPPPLEPTQSASAVWTGSDVLILAGEPQAALVAFSPATGSWRNLASPPYANPSGFDVAWTGERLFAWPRFDRNGRVPLLYDPGSDVWTEIDTPPEIADIDTPSVVWTGSQVLVWGVGVRTPSHQRGALWDPDGDWKLISPPPIPPVEWGEWTPGSQAMTWTGSTATVWVGALDNNPHDSSVRTLEFDPASDTWAVLPAFTQLTPDLVMLGMVSGDRGPVVVTNSGDYVLGPG